MENDRSAAKWTKGTLALFPVQTLILAAPLTAAPEPAKPLTPSDIVAAAPASAWRTIPAEDLLVIDYDAGGRTVVQLAPTFAPVHVANIRALASGGYWQGSAVYRVQDNYVAQWGTNDDKKPLPPGIVAKPPAEYVRSARGFAIRPLGFADPYAVRTGHAGGWPVAQYRDGSVSLIHCYGTVGVGRDLAPDTGMGGELYAVIGHAPRQLDRNIAIVGRVVEGIEQMSALPRGTEALGFYKEGSVARKIASVRLASALPAADRPSFQYMAETSPTFAAYARARANRNDPFYRVAAGGVDICNAPVPVRRTPAQ
ncbi:peptidylprolyl isomerase [Sphingomonas sp. BN140010]|uniref:Peptidylprolyl isomerase n=1 Tax=Sphingomonas arvum TaxID=2992113 RepID=A0ABT3JB18_9SPHN|nr:peptidylprolyl isomerase [Sphingomonas sp. BN140010]MCW3796266.1 peptidylprolyl isomerase [Sphingomonas sp. BN140010]